jgi:hypothetical protein
LFYFPAPKETKKENKTKGNETESNSTKEGEGDEKKSTMN